MKKVVIFGVLVAIVAAVAFNASLKSKKEEAKKEETNQVSENNTNQVPDAVNENVQVAQVGAAGEVATSPKIITTADLLQLITADKSVTIIDARATKGLEKTGIIPGAKNVPATDVTEENLAKLGLTKASSVVFYCSGLTCSASKIGAEKASQLGYTNVYEYSEGLEGWVKAGNKAEKFAANTATNSVNAPAKK